MLGQDSIKYRSCGVMGAEVLGIDLRKVMDAATFDALRDTLLERELLLFREQQISDQQFVRFAAKFGRLEGPTLTQFTPSGCPEILIVSNGVKDGQPMGLVEVGHFWHSDGSYLRDLDMYTTLYGVEIPLAADDTPLGDTLFTSGYAAYSDLSEDMKSRLGDLSANFSYDWRYQQRLKNNPTVPAARPKSERPDQSHRVIRPHPVTGRKTIFANEGYVTHIENVSPAQSTQWLNALFTHLYSERYRYTHRWQPGDVLIWDNNSAQHNAIGNYKLPQFRLMKRITIKSEWPRPNAIAA